MAHSVREVCIRHVYIYIYVYIYINIINTHCRIHFHELRLKQDVFVATCWLDGGVSPVFTGLLLGLGWGGMLTFMLR